EEALDGEVGHEQARVVARRGGDPLGELPALWPRKLDGDRLLALVQPLPLETVAARVERPTPEVRPPADLVDADDLGAELGGVQAPARAARQNVGEEQTIVHRRARPGSPRGGASGG